MFDKFPLQIPASQPTIPLWNFNFRYWPVAVSNMSRGSHSTTVLLSRRRTDRLFEEHV